MFHFGVFCSKDIVSLWSSFTKWFPFRIHVFNVCCALLYGCILYWKIQRMWTRTSDPPIHPAFVLLSCVNFQKKKKGDKVWAWNSAWKCPPPRSHPTQIVIMIIETPARYNQYCVRNHNLEPPTHPPF